MLKVAKVGKGDVVYDLGSGDGRIPIAAVKDFGAARATGIDIDPQRIKEADREPRRRRASAIASVSSIRISSRRTQRSARS